MQIYIIGKQVNINNISKRKIEELKLQMIKKITVNRKRIQGENRKQDKLGQKTYMIRKKKYKGIKTIKNNRIKQIQNYKIGKEVLNKNKSDENKIKPGPEVV